MLKMEVMVYILLRQESVMILNKIAKVKLKLCLEVFCTSIQ